MKVKKTIRIRKENIRELKKLECVESIEQNGRDILVRLNPEYTEGKQEAVRDEYLVQWGSGKWQRFGEAAFTIISTRILQRRRVRHGTSRF